MQSQKWQNDLCALSRQIIQYYSYINLFWNYNVGEVEVEWFYEDLQDILELTPRKDVLFFVEDWNAKVGSQELPGVTGKIGLGV